MMDLDTARRHTGALVSYRPGGDRPVEYGLIITTRREYVFVRFVGTAGPQAVAADLLTLEVPPVPAPDEPQVVPPVLDREALVTLLDEWLDDEAPLQRRTFYPVADAILSRISSAVQVQS